MCLSRAKSLSLHDYDLYIYYNIYIIYIITVYIYILYIHIIYIYIYIIIYNQKIHILSTSGNSMYIRIIYGTYPLGFASPLGKCKKSSTNRTSKTTFIYIYTPHVQMIFPLRPPLMRSVPSFSIFYLHLQMIFPLKPLFRSGIQLKCPIFIHSSYHHYESLSLDGYTYVLPHQ